MIDFYFDKLGFEDNFRVVFDEYLNKENLCVYTNQVFFYVDKKNLTPSYTNKTYSALLSLIQIGNVLDNNSNWKKIIIPSEHQQPLIHHLYKSMDVRFHPAFEVVVSKMFAPQKVAQAFFKISPQLLESYLICKKLTTKEWGDTSLFEYVEKLYENKTMEEKKSFLTTCLKRNRLPSSHFNLEIELKNFLTKNNLLPHEDFQLFLNQYKDDWNKSQEMFAEVPNTIIIDLNKNSIYKNINLYGESVLNIGAYEKMIDSLPLILNHKKLKSLKIQNSYICQKTQKHHCWRLILDCPQEQDSNLKKIELQKFIRYYFQVYENRFTQQTAAIKKDQVLECAQKALLIFEMDQELKSKKINIVKKHKI